MKTTYERFIEANTKLFKCFESVPHDEWNALSHEEQGSLCHSEKAEVQEFLTNGSVGFASLLKERLDIVSHKPH